MRTTIDLPDELFRQVKARAALDGLKLKELIARYIEQGLNTTSQGRRRSPLPVARSATGVPLPLRSNADLFAILGQEELDGPPRP